MTAENRIKACEALLNMKRALPYKQVKYQKDRPARFEMTDVDESSSDGDESQVENPSDLDGLGYVRYERNGANTLALPRLLPSIADTNTKMNNMWDSKNHHSGPAQVTCSEGSSSSEESQQRRYSPLTSHPSEEMNPATKLGTGNTSRTDRLWDQSLMVLVKRAPKALPSKPSIPIRPSPPQHHSPMSQAPVLFRPVLIPAALDTIKARSSQTPVVRDLNRHIPVRARNYEKMSHAVLQQALQLIHAPTNIRTKPKALQYLKSYFLAVRDRSHVIYVEKYKLVSPALVCD
jgi:hypothetical protein